MSRIFLSHSSANNAEAVAVRDWMQTQGWDDVFLDLDPERGLVAGDRWHAALKAAVDQQEGERSRPVEGNYNGIGCGTLLTVQSFDVLLYS